MIGGSSLNDAISKLTNNTFTNVSDFQDKFNGGTATGMGQFLEGLLKRTGDGRGALVTGDLTATDLALDTPITGLNLFKLDPTHDRVTNVYPDDYPILSGGTTSTGGVAPTGFEGITYDFGDFAVIGAEPGEIEYDKVSGTLTISGSSDVIIRMKDNLVEKTTQKIELKGTDNITLQNIDTTAEINITEDAKLTLSGSSQVGNVTVDNGKSVIIDGSGSLEAATSVRAGENGEGTYNTSGVKSGPDGKDLYSWTLHLYELFAGLEELPGCENLHEDKDGNPITELNNGNEYCHGTVPIIDHIGTDGKLYDAENKVIEITSITATGVENPSVITWLTDLTHTTVDGETDSYLYLWMTGQDQDLKIEYTESQTMKGI